MSARPPLEKFNANLSDLVNLMLQYIDDSVVQDHKLNGQHTYDEEFFIWHKNYILGMEKFLSANGGDAFVPLPYWDPRIPIPDAFNVVKPYDDGTMGEGDPRDPDVPQPIRDPLEHLGPFGWNSGYDYPTVCREFSNADSLGQAVENEHNTIHGSIGGTMGAVPTASAAPIFWCWHAFLDKIYDDWLACSQQKAKAQ